MRIESMTATFGKLQTQTLTLEPGLNLLQMPNETGKSTWCAFLLAMLYGVDTSERKTRTNLPAKEHYAPWSGSAMEGQLRVEHEGRRITIERSSTARAPLAVFRAFDTEDLLGIAQKILVEVATGNAVVALVVFFLHVSEQELQLLGRDGPVGGIGGQVEIVQHQLAAAIHRHAADRIAPVQIHDLHEPGLDRQLAPRGGGHPVG